MSHLVAWLTQLYRDLVVYPSITLTDMDYDQYWRERESVELRIKPRFRIFAELIEPGSSVLDLGCGDGTNLAYLLERKQIVPFGIDLSPGAVRQAQARGIEAVVADIADSGFHLQGRYDYIILSEVVEHLPYPENLLLRVRDHFHKGLLVTIPNTGFYRYRLRLLLGRFPVQWVYHPGEHLRYWTVKDFVWWVEQFGYRIKRTWASSGTRLGPLQLRQRWPNLWAYRVIFWLEAVSASADEQN